MLNTEFIYYDQCKALLWSRLFGGQGQSKSQIVSVLISFLEHVVGPLKDMIRKINVFKLDLAYEFYLIKLHLLDIH